MKSKLVIILKIVVAIATAILGVLGASALSSCKATLDTNASHRGFGVFHYVDTVYTNGNIGIIVK